MTCLLNELSPEDLISIVDCKKFKTLCTKFGETKAKILINEANQLVKNNIHNDKIIQSIFSTITDGPSYLFLMLWTILGSVSFSLMPLALITLGFSFPMCVVAGIFLYSNYQDLNKEAEKNERSFKLLNLKRQCIDELIDRQRDEIDKQWRNKIVIETSLMKNISESNVKPDKNKMHKIKQSIGKTIIIGSTLFGTFYLGTHTIISAFGLSTAAATMMGPIGIGIALAVSFGIGLYFGYKYYQIRRNQEVQKKHEKELNNEIELKHKQYDEGKEKLKKLKTVIFDKEREQNNSTHFSEEYNEVDVKYNASTHSFFYKHPMTIMNQNRKIREQEIHTSSPKILI